MPARALPTRTLVVLVTCPKRSVADRVARTLVSEGLAACVNVIPGLISTYRWQGKICRDPELLLIIKTRRPLLLALIDRVQALHPYTVPEIIALPLAGGSPAYLAWVTDVTPGPIGPAQTSSRPRTPHGTLVRRAPGPRQGAPRTPGTRAR
jgi:periplasmic divalent cation tolerance protein